MVGFCSLAVFARAGRVLAALLFLIAGPANAAGPDASFNIGLTRLTQPDGGELTVFHPTAVPEAPIRQGPFTLAVALDAAPVKGNGRLVVISHGSGGSPWVHYDLARALVRRGFTVALPQHRADNYRDHSAPGPASWRIRPREVSAAIDRIAASRFGRHLETASVGVFGGSAGGHTALAFAGGRWSEARFRDHCEQHAERDFAACAGMLTHLRGNATDGFKLWALKRVIGWKFSDTTLQEHSDARVKAALAMAPCAADFVPASLRQPRIPLGLVVARQDVHLVPAFHVERILAACQPRCELVMDLAQGSHGAMLSPAPPLDDGSLAQRLLGDPPGFPRQRAIAELNARIVGFFERHLRGRCRR